MEKLLELEKKLREYKASLEKNSEMGYDEVNQSEKHDDKKEDKREIAEALDTHNEKKHDEPKDKNSAYKDLHIKKQEDDVIKMEAISFAKNGQWSLDKGLGSKLDNAEHKDKVSQALGSIRQPAKVLNAEGEEHIISPEKQVQDKASAKAQKNSAAKVKAEADAAARRASYKK